jgi:hypothetical protein
VLISFLLAVEAVEAEALQETLAEAEVVAEFYRLAFQ